MKPSIARFYSTCIFLFAPFFISAQLHVGDSLFAAGNYLGARVAYERSLFERNSNASAVLLKKSFCFKAEAKYEEAYLTLERADFFTGTDSFRHQLYYESALNAYLAGKYDLTISKLQELNYYIPGVYYQPVEILELLALNALGKWEEAEKKFLAYQRSHQLTNGNPYSNKKARALKNPEKAETLSFLFPGAGQMYAGYVGRGFTSLMLQTGLVAFSVYSFVNGFYFSGAFTGVSLFYLFYNGGARHAKYLAEKRNTEKLLLFNNEVKSKLMK